MRIGVDTSKFPGAAAHGPLWTLGRIASLGLEGAFFRSAFDLSATLDAGELREVAQEARQLGLYLEAGVAKVNPFATPEAPQIRILGDGDYLAGLAKTVRAATAAGITELWSATAGYQFRIAGLRACDRFRTDVDWREQLAATATVLDRLGPVLRDCGAHLNLETHEEITSFEVVRLVEQAGPDAFGITFDTANVLVRCEDPVAAAKRVAPYVRQMHVRDAALLFTDDGIGRFLAPVGQGVVEWPELLGALLAEAPDLHLSVEGVAGSTAEMPLYLGDPEWRAGHPDLTVDEFAAVVDLTRRYERAAARGERPGLTALRRPVEEPEQLEFLVASAAELRAQLRETSPVRRSERKSR